MTDHSLTVTTRAVGERVAVLTVSGEIDRASREVLATAAADVLEQGRHRLVLDLTGLEFCDSSGLSLFVELHRRTLALAGGLRLGGARPLVATVILATSLDRLLRLHPTADAAVDAALRDD
ncbi:STAS domain-containing protein [Actinoplanes utahensis]|uniref:Anti-sigma factor antagonist n=1 Tax=Actinoplanes utahensis TaxID=1869 RepID=A0A0A6UMI3_ACTUT|nr:STAS domain-containing protein [Actinoplanes utahensis]KHD77310.1 hypothetical protein MB27_11050 [Actinoplanes utahensis]GIF32970.1 hypothetical protein Aut01nite_59560 [Actinoplanes utahensis]